MAWCLLEDGLGRLRGRRLPGGLRAAQAEVGQRRANVDHDGALERVLGRRGVEVVGRAERVVGLGDGALLGSRHTHHLRVGGLLHHVSRDGERLLKLLREILGLGANGHCNFFGLLKRFKRMTYLSRL